MAKAVSRRQLNMMRAIVAGKISGDDCPRGCPPKSVAGKYIRDSKNSKDLPEQDGENKGGNWNEHSHSKDKERVKSKREDKKKAKAKLKKSFEEFYKGTGRAAATIVLDAENSILMGLHNGKLAFPGGHVDPIDQGDTSIAALRELKEETNLQGINPSKIYSGIENGNKVDVFLVESFKGKLKGGSDLSSPRWVKLEEIDWSKVRDCCVRPLKHFIETKLGKSLKGMIALEALNKNIIRQRGDAVFEVSHGDALKLVGNGLFRRIKAAVSGMEDESFKDVKIDTYTVSIRKHMNDVYSGRVSDGHKMVYQFTNKSLPELTAALMSVFEWYSPEDEQVFDLVDEKDLSDDAIHGGLNNLIEEYKRHNISNMYEEMETIREQMRNGMAIDLQQVEARLTKLFDKLEENLLEITDKHNKLSTDAGEDIDELENKLMELQRKIEEMSSRPEKVEAYSPNPSKKDKILDEYYPYLSKPQIEIFPSGKINITFGSDWQNLEKENFLTDLRAKVISKKAGA